MARRETCDLLIVGASFAGLVAARTAAMRGLDVVVLEAKPEAGARVATTGILVTEAAEEIDLPHHLTRRVHGVRLYTPNLRHIDLFAPASFFLTAATAGLLRWLAREAERAGARIRYGVRFAGAERATPPATFSVPTAPARPWRGTSGSAATCISWCASKPNSKGSIPSIRASCTAASTTRWRRAIWPGSQAGRM